MSHDIGPRYNHKEVEEKIYELWEKSGYFNPDNLPQINADRYADLRRIRQLAERGTMQKSPRVSALSPRKSTFCIVLPPPNVTGLLHIGHAVMLAVEDIMIRYNRMKGRKTLWVPGTDHAAIATQSKVESILYKQEGKTRYDLGRDAFLKRVEGFAKESHDTIVKQTKKMGASVDWSREAYTLDAKRSLAVRTAFKRMYDEGLIYRGSRIVNWDPKMKTTVSDDEVERIEEKAPFYYFKYGPFVIGTARPETKFGDKYVVLHPADKRYKNYKHGEKLRVEWINGPITAMIIKDKAVDMSFGTGVMTITPWHDAIDFEIAERHSLDKEQIIDYDGKLLPIAGEFAGMHIKKARPLIVEKLKSKGLLVKVDENYSHNIAVNSRGRAVIEPQIKEQWFIDVNKKFVIQHSRIKGMKSGSKVSLKELMRAMVKNKQIEIIPRRFEKIYFHWIDNLRDWCISRQIWFGHQIPVWYKNKKIFCDVRPPKEAGFRQDPDTLDTWFSSGLWTFSVFGWPEETSDLQEFHPTSVLETGYDILFFWVARMILMTGYLLHDVPFHKVYLHGLVRDEQGRKMSKSLGNIINPLDMIEKYNADATRFSLVVGAAPGNDTKLSEDKIRGYRNFTTKIWNAARFVLMNYPSTSSGNKKNSLNTYGKKYSLSEVEEIQYSTEDRKNLKELEKIKAKVTKDLENFQFHHAAETLYHYFWHTFADKIIEAAKPRLNSNNQKDKAAAQELLLQILFESLKMLHPFMPFVTEEIYQKLPIPKKKLLMVEEW